MPFSFCFYLFFVCCRMKAKTPLDTHVNPFRFMLFPCCLRCCFQSDRVDCNIQLKRAKFKCLVRFRGSFSFGASSLSILFFISYIPLRSYIYRTKVSSITSFMYKCPPNASRFVVSFEKYVNWPPLVTIFNAPGL